MSKKRRQSRKKPRQQPSSSRHYIASVIPGTESFARDEIIRRTRGQVHFLESPRDDEHRFVGGFESSVLTQLRLTQSLHLSIPLDVKGPGTLMSEPYYKRCLTLIQRSMALREDCAYSGLRFDAAGSNSPTFQQFGARLSESLGVPYANNDGDLLITVRPFASGWELMCRVGNRPLGTRAWRKADFRGGLNAAVASAIVESSQPEREDSFCNLMCGSGTLMIERLLRRGADRVVGVDLSPGILAKARANVEAAGLADRVQLIRATVEYVPLESERFDVVCADLPWGEALGDRQDNVDRYAFFLKESRRILKPGGRLLALTADPLSLRISEKQAGEGLERLEDHAFVQREIRSVCRVYRRS